MVVVQIWLLEECWGLGCSGGLRVGLGVGVVLGLVLGVVVSLVLSLEVDLIDAVLFWLLGLGAF